MSVDTNTLESMCELIVDCPHSTPEWTDEGYVVTRNQNIKNGVLDLSSPSFTSRDDYLKRIKRAKPKAGDIIFTREAPMGEVCMIPDGLECCLGQRQVLLRPKENICGEYLFWALQSPYVQNQISWNEGTGSTVSNVRIPVLKALNIPRLPNEERNISKVLSDVARKIELNRQTNQTLEQIAQAIFKSWFVDFEPVKAKIEAKQNGQDPELAAMCAISGKTEEQLKDLIKEADAHGSANVAGGTTPRATLQQLKITAAMFPDVLVESELGEIPEGWSMESIYEIADVIYGAAFKSKLFNDDGEGFPLVRIRDLKHERPGVSTEEVHQKGYLIQNGDLLVGMDGEFRPYIWGGNEAWMNQRVCTFKPKKKLSAALVKEFITRQLRFFELTAVATTVIHLGKGDIDGFTYLESNNELLLACSSVLEPIFQRIVSNKIECISLEKTRDTLLPKLLSGDLSLDIEKKELNSSYG